MRLVTLLLLACTFWTIPSRADDSDDLHKKIAPYFQPPKELAGDFGKYRSPLLFDDGSPVKTPADWQKRRGEIQKTWHDALGAWPDLITEPKIVYLEKERRGNVTQHHVKITLAPGVETTDAYLLIPDGDGPMPAAVVVFYDAKTGIGQKEDIGKTPARKTLDFAWQLAQRGYVTLSIGSPPATYYPSKDNLRLQPLSYDAYIAANCWHILASLKQVDARRIGIIGHSYGGKWAMFASAFFDRFAFAVWSDPGIVFDEARGNVNYWEPWYLGFEKGRDRKPGKLSDEFPRQGPYKKLVESGHDLHELHALLAPRPFLVSGGSEDGPARWKALNHAIVVNRLLGKTERVAMTNRPTHAIDPQASEQIYNFFDWFLKHGEALR
jgi:dienelactone hydrolase